MASLFGDFVANNVQQGRVALVATGYVPLVSNTDGITPFPSRRHVRIQLKSITGGAMAIVYVQRNADGTFTTPTTSVKLVTIMSGNTTWVEPVSDKVQIFGKLVKRSGFTSNSINVVVTEFA